MGFPVRADSPRIPTHRNGLSALSGCGRHSLRHHQPTAMLAATPTHPRPTGQRTSASGYGGAIGAATAPAYPARYRSAMCHARRHHRLISIGRLHCSAILSPDCEVPRCTTPQEASTAPPRRQRLARHPSPPGIKRTGPQRQPPPYQGPSRYRHPLERAIVAPVYHVIFL